MSISDKHVRFASCYLSIDTNDNKQLKFIESTHYKQPNKRILKYKCEEHNKHNTLSGMLDWLISFSSDYTTHNFNPLLFLNVCKNIINNSDKIIYGNKIFNVNWNLYYKHRVYIPELKTILYNIYSSSHEIINEYYINVRSIQREYKDYAYYLCHDDVKNYKRIYDTHNDVFIKRYLNLVKQAKTTNLTTWKISSLVNSVLDVINQYKLTNEDIKMLNRRVKNNNVVELMETFYKSFGNNIPINKLHQMIKYYIIGDNRKCEAFEVLDELGTEYHYMNDDGTVETLEAILKVFNCYKRNRINPLLGRPRGYGGGRVGNYTI